MDPMQRYLFDLLFNYINKNIKIEDIEKITTEAGTFECVKFSYDVAMNMLISKNYHVTTWYNEDAGLVRQETYNKKGQLETKTELTGYAKGK